MSAFLWHPLSTITTKYFLVVRNFVIVKLEITIIRIMNFESWHEKREWLTENLWPKFHDIEFRNFVTVTKFLLTFNVGHEIFLDRHDFFLKPSLIHESYTIIRVFQAILVLVFNTHRVCTRDSWIRNYGNAQVYCNGMYSIWWLTFKNECQSSSRVVSPGFFFFGKAKNPWVWSKF